MHGIKLKRTRSFRHPYRFQITSYTSLITQHQNSHDDHSVDKQPSLQLTGQAWTAPNFMQHIQCIHHYDASTTSDNQLPPYSPVIPIAITPTHSSLDNDRTAWTAPNIMKEKTFIPDHLQQLTPILARQRYPFQVASTITGL